MHGCFCEKVPSFFFAFLLKEEICPSIMYFSKIFWASNPFLHHRVFSHCTEIKQRTYFFFSIFFFAKLLKKQPFFRIVFTRYDRTVKNWEKRRMSGWCLPIIINGIRLRREGDLAVQYNGIPWGEGRVKSLCWIIEKPSHQQVNLPLITASPPFKQLVPFVSIFGWQIYCMYGVPLTYHHSQIIYIHMYSFCH